MNRYGRFTAVSALLPVLLALASPASATSQVLIDAAERAPAWWIPHMVLDSDMVAYGRIESACSTMPEGSAECVTFVEIAVVEAVKGCESGDLVTFYLTECEMVDRSEYSMRRPCYTYAPGDSFMVFLEMDSRGELQDRLLTPILFKRGRARTRGDMTTDIKTNAPSEWVSCAREYVSLMEANEVARAVDVAVVGTVAAIDDTVGSADIVTVDVEQVVGITWSVKTVSFSLQGRHSAFSYYGIPRSMGSRDTPVCDVGDRIVALLRISRDGGFWLVGGRRGLLVIDEASGLGCVTARSDVVEGLPELLRGRATVSQYACHDVEALLALVGTEDDAGEPASSN